MTAHRAARTRRPVLPIIVTTLLAAACGGAAQAGPADGADTDRPEVASMELVVFSDVADEVGLDFRHGAFKWGTSGDPPAMMGGGLCWIDVDRDSWLDLFVVSTWSDGEWAKWNDGAGLPTSRLFRNDRGRFVDVTDDVGAGLAVRGNGCVAADLDLDGWTDLYVTTDRQNVLLWNDGGSFEVDEGAAGVDAYGWHTGAAVGDVDGDGRPDLFVAGYLDPNRPIPDATKGFPNTQEPEPDLLFLNTGPDADGRTAFREIGTAAGLESDRLDYGLGALFTDVDRDGDLDLYVANDTNPNRLYVNEPVDGGLGFRMVDEGGSAGVDDDNAGMGVAAGDFDANGTPDLVVTNMGKQGHVIFSGAMGPTGPSYLDALAEMGLLEMGRGLTGWGTTWADVDLDGDQDLVIAHGAIPVSDLGADREPVTLFETVSDPDSIGSFRDVSSLVGLDEVGPYLARGLAAADFDNDGDLDLAIGTVGSELALLRNSGAGGHWLGVTVEPATPGTVVTITLADGPTQQRELLAGSSYLSSEDPRSHFGLGNADRVDTLRVEWPDGSTVTREDVAADQFVVVGSA